MPPSLVMSLDLGQMSGLLLVSANRQSSGTTDTGVHILDRVANGKNLAWKGLAKAC